MGSTAKEMEALLNATIAGVPEQKKSQALKLPSVYITGFCAVGGHENTVTLSPKGSLLRSCAGEYWIQSGWRTIEVNCTCVCHAQFREMRAIAAAAKEREEEAAFFRDAVARTFQHDAPPTLPATDAPSAPAAPVAPSNTPPPPAPRKPELMIVDLSGSFKPTPTGRAARGQLEEKVRVVVAKYHVQMHDLMTPQIIGQYVDKENPPSPGAIYAIFKRWEGQALCVLGTKPFRLVELTERGKRQLIH